MVSICAEGGLVVEPELITKWLKKEEDPEYVRCSDHEMAQFLNGFIIEKRGKKDDGIPKAEYSLNNNIIFRKLKIALNFKDQDILDTLEKAEFMLGKAELTAFFRNPEHRHYRECQDQILRNFLQGLQMNLTNQSTAEPQSKYQAIKGQLENKKTERKENKGKPKDTKPFLKPKKPKEKVVYQNPNIQKKEETTIKPKRAKISLKKDSPSNQNESNTQKPKESTPTVNESIWGNKK